MTVTRYHPILVTLHWFVGLLIVLQLAGGYFFLAKMPNSDLAKVGALQVHASLGMAILTLMIIRLVTRLFTTKPPPTANQQQGAGRLRVPVHLAIYALVFIIVASGWYTGLLVSNVWATPGTTLPADLASYPTRLLHVWSALLLFLLIVLHVLAVIMERASGNASIMGRMWFGRRSG